MKIKSILAAAFAVISILAQATPTAKAVYNSDTKTLTLYYDELSHDGEGEIGAFATTQGWSIPDAKTGATNAVIDASMASFQPTSLYKKDNAWFYGYGQLKKSLVWRILMSPRLRPSVGSFRVRRFPASSTFRLSTPLVPPR